MRRRARAVSIRSIRPGLARFAPGSTASGIRRWRLMPQPPRGRTMMNVEAQHIKPAPIRRELRVKASRQKAFDTFVAMGGWWLKSHSLTASGQKDVIIEPRAGGRWYEIANDGSEQLWGKVVAYEAP